MLLELLVGALLVGAVVCYVIGDITKENTKEQMAEHNMGRALVKTIDTCSNRIKLEDLDSGAEMEIEGDGISDEIYQGQVIYA